MLPTIININFLLNSVPVNNYYTVRLYTNNGDLANSIGDFPIGQHYFKAAVTCAYLCLIIDFNSLSNLHTCRPGQVYNALCAKRQQREGGP